MGVRKVDFADIPFVFVVVRLGFQENWLHVRAALVSVRKMRSRTKLPPQTRNKIVSS